MLDKFKKLNNPKFYTLLIFAFLIIQPIVDLDYLLNDFLKQYHLIVPSTFIRFLGIPLLAIIGFLFFDKNKRKSFWMIVFLGLILGTYSILHFIEIRQLNLNLPETFRTDIKIELKYILIMTLPFILMYCTYLAQFSNETFNKIIVITSVITCSVIFITDLFAISFGSYGGTTQANFFSWFTGGYEQFQDPKLLMSKGLYHAANVLGALLFMLLPLLYKVLYEVKRKWPIFLLILLHSLCMMMVGTRVATFGVILIAIAALGTYIGCSVIRLAKFNLNFLLNLGIIIFLALAIYPNTPAIKYQEFNTQLIKNLKEEEEKNDSVNQMSTQLELLQQKIEDDDGKKAILIAVLRENAQLLTFPSIYYDEIYPIEFDPEFWNFVVNQPFEKRSDGRKLQKLFSEYKWDLMDTKEKMLGMGFSTLSEGQLIIEQDGWRQIYTMGIIGAIIFITPYLVLVLASTINALRKFKTIVNFSNLMLLLSIGVGLGAAYYSGHVLDELFTNLYLGFITVTLFLNTTLSKKDYRKVKVK